MKPFDEKLPSPISAVIGLRASSRDSVVVVGSETESSSRMFVDDGLASRILARATSKEPSELILIGGSAGGGKSAVISKLKSMDPGAFEKFVEDATHSDSPRSDQIAMLQEFFAPFRDGKRPRRRSKPRLIAMNTGMVLNFFDRIDVRESGLGALESVLKAKLGVPAVGPRAAGHDELAPAIVVANLEHRGTTGGNSALFRSMIASVAPGNREGVLAGAARCSTCKVRSYCFVRTNAELISSAQVAPHVDALAHVVALERGRPIPPRDLWDLLADLVTGGEPFAEADPCDRIAQIAKLDDAALVWKRLLCNGAFTRPDPDGPTARVGRLAERIRALDPSMEPSEGAHALLATAGIVPAHDAEVLAATLGNLDGDSGATGVAARYLANPRVEDGGGARSFNGRGLVRAQALAGKLPLVADSISATFQAAVEDLHAKGDQAALGKFIDIVRDGLVEGFGAVAASQTFVRAEALDPRRKTAVLVEAELGDREYLELGADPVTRADPESARLVGYRPLAVPLRLGGAVELQVTLPVFRVLARAAAGTVVSTADLESFYGLRRAMEYVGMKASQNEASPLLLIQPDGNFVVRWTRGPLGRTVLTVKPVSLGGEA